MRQSPTPHLPPYLNLYRVKRGEGVHQAQAVSSKLNTLITSDNKLPERFNSSRLMSILKEIGSSVKLFSERSSYL